MKRRITKSSVLEMIPPAPARTSDESTKGIRLPDEDHSWLNFPLLVALLTSKVEEDIFAGLKIREDAKEEYGMFAYFDTM